MPQDQKQKVAGTDLGAALALFGAGALVLTGGVMRLVLTARRRRRMERAIVRVTGGAVSLIDAGALVTGEWRACPGAADGGFGGEPLLSLECRGNRN